MPTYQYACTECVHSFEQFQDFRDDALTVCPQCQGRLRKVFNAVGVVFKGSGFYRTDSRSDAENGKAATPAKVSESGSSPGESSSGEASQSTPDKPAAKPAEKTESSSSRASRPTDSTSAA